MDAGGELSFELSQILKLVKEGSRNVENIPGLLQRAQTQTQRNIHGLTLMDYIRLFRLEDLMIFAAALEASPEVPSLVESPPEDEPMGSEESIAFLESLLEDMERPEPSNHAEAAVGRPNARCDRLFFPAESTMIRRLPNITGRGRIRIHENSYNKLAKEAQE